MIRVRRSNIMYAEHIKTISTLVATHRCSQPITRRSRTDAEHIVSLCVSCRSAVASVALSLHPSTTGPLSLDLRYFSLLAKRAVGSQGPHALDRYLRIGV